MPAAPGPLRCPHGRGHRPAGGTAGGDLPGEGRGRRGLRRGLSRRLCRPGIGRTLRGEDTPRIPPKSDDAPAADARAGPGAELAGDTVWTAHLAPEEVEELAAALRGVQARG